MVNCRQSIWISKRCWLLAFCFFILYPAMGLEVCSASLLKDIRIGEHSGFTRIVFVLDVPTSNSRVEALSTKKVRITINATKPDLKRKIQIEQGLNIEDIRIVTEREQLSTIFELDRAYTKISSFQMKKPPRLVFDIFWQTEATAAAKPVPEQDSVAESPSTDFSIIETDREPEVTATPLSETADVFQETDATPSAMSVETLSAQSEAPQPKVQHEAGSEKESVTDTARTSTDMGGAEKTVPSDLLVDKAQEPQQATSWLQYYLIIALVVMTIAILFLLVVMLLSKYQPAGDTAHLDANEYLKQQDKDLASLDERIKEQLKRYDEA